MSATIPRFSFCIVLLASLAGCGGSSGGSTGCVSNCGGGGGNPTVVTYTFTGGTPVAVATKIGTGAYTQATLASGKLSVSVPSGTTNYSVAYLCPTIAWYSPPRNEEYVVQASTLDGASFTENCVNPTAPQQGLATLQVNTAAIPGAGDLVISNGCEWQNSFPSTSSISCPMPIGTYDVFVVVFNMDGGNPLAAKILRSQTIPGALNGGNPVVFTASDETVTQTITYNNVSSGATEYLWSVDYFTAGGQEYQLAPAFYSPSMTSYPAMPAGAMQSGDYYTFDVQASSATGGPVGVNLATSSGGPQTITFPATPWTYSGPSPAALPTFNFDYSGFSGMSSVMQEASITWSPGAPPVNTIQITATENYQNGATSLTIPNLSGLTGFLAPAPSGTSVGWLAIIQQGSAFQTNPPNGTVQNVQNSGRYTEP